MDSLAQAQTLTLSFEVHNLDYFICRHCFVTTIFTFWYIHPPWNLSRYHESNQQSIPYGTMMTSSNGNIFRVTGLLFEEFTGHRCIPPQRPVTGSFGVSWTNKRLGKQSKCRWFETPSRSLWRNRNDNSARKLTHKLKDITKIPHGNTPSAPYWHNLGYIKTSQVENNTTHILQVQSNNLRIFINDEISVLCLAVRLLIKFYLILSYHIYLKMYTGKHIIRLLHHDIEYLIW